MLGTLAFFRSAGATAWARAGAAASLPVVQAVSAVAASDDGAVALTREDVRVLDGAGRLLARFPVRGAPPVASGRRSRRREATGFAAAAGVLGDDDFDDPHDADDAVEDPVNITVADDASARRRPARAAAPPLVVLAAGGPNAWVGRGDGLWRVSFRGGGATRVAGPVRALAAAPGGSPIVVASGDGLAWSDDGGEHFERSAGGEAAARGLAVTASGRVFTLDRGGLRRVRVRTGDRPRVAPLVAGATDAVGCGSAALILSRDRLMLWPDGQDDAIEGPPAPPGAAHVACGDDGAIWVAYGPALWLSADRGRSWTRRLDAPASPLAAVAVTRTALWVAGPAGLVRLPLGEDGQGPLVARPAPRPAPAALDLPPARRWSWWVSALPRVDIGFATARSSTRRDVRAFLLLSFALGGGRDAMVARRLDEEAAAARRSAETRRLLASGAPREAPDDPIGAEERDATLRLLEE